MNNFFPYTDNFLNSGSFFLLLSMASRLLSPGDSFEAQPVKWWMKKRTKAKGIIFAWIHFLIISSAILMVSFTGGGVVFFLECAKLGLTKKILTNYLSIVFSCSMSITLMTGLKEFHSFFHVTSPPQRKSVEIRSVHFENKFKVCVTQMSFQIASARHEWIIKVLKRYKWSLKYLSTSLGSL